MNPRPPALPRQLFRFLLVGFAQLGLDSLVYIVTSALGVPVAASNIAGRVAGVALGFWAHGRWTFAGAGHERLQGGTLLRFLACWALLTAASTLLVGEVARMFGLRGSWLAKPLVEGVLAVLSFVLMRHWVFRRA